MQNHPSLPAPGLPRPNYRLLRACSLGMFLGLLMFTGASTTMDFSGRAPPSADLQLFLTLGCSFCVVTWLWADAAVRGVRIIHSWSWMTFCYWPVAWPAYLIWRGRGWGLLEAGVYLASIVAALLAGGIVGFILAAI